MKGLTKGERKTKEELVKSLGETWDKLDMAIAAYNHELAEARDLIEEIGTKSQNAFERMSGKRQDTEEGRALGAFAKKWEEVSMEFDEDLEPPATQHHELLKDLPDEPEE